MLGWLRDLWSSPRAIPDELWRQTLAQYPFLEARTVSDQSRLLSMTERFLQQKQFSGAHGLLVTDEMAVAIAVQACLPVLNLSLKLYDDFKGIVVHRGAMIARLTTVDAAGIHHFYKETLAGEAMDGGPITLSWRDIQPSSDHLERGYNVVIHEFAHKLDMRDGTPNGCPPLPTLEAKAEWQLVMQSAYESFTEQVALAERFGAPRPWLDAYAATSPAEFFAVTCEAYFVNPTRFATEFAGLKPLFDAFFNPKPVQK